MTPTPYRDVVILAGDEAMLGRPSDAARLEEWTGRVVSAEIWTDGDWQPLLASPATFIGPECAMAEIYGAEAPAPLGLVKLAVPGTSLTQDWHGQYTGHLLDDLLVTLREMMTAGPVRLRGFVWYQGAADLADNRRARVYDTWLSRLVEKLRLGTGIPDLPVLTVVPHAPVNPTSAVTAMRRALLRRDDTRIPVAAPQPEAEDGCLPEDGLDLLGRRLAHVLLGIEGTVRGADRPRHWLWNDDRHQVWIEGETLAPEAALVTLPFVSNGDGFMEPAYAQRLAMSRGLTSIHVRAARNDWFQTETFPQIAAAIRSAVPDTTHLVTYGSSMGGFGALLFSGPLRAERAIALAPQVSIDRTLVPFETRWRRAAADIGPFIHTLDRHMTPEGRKLVVYDPLSPDAAHVHLMPEGRGIEHLRLAFAAHHVGEYLQETNALEMLVQDILVRGPNRRNLVRRVRANRRKSHFYWHGRAEALAARGHPLAEEAITQLEALGGAERKLRMLRETLEKRRSAKAAS